MPSPGRPSRMQTQRNHLNPAPFWSFTLQALHCQATFKQQLQVQDVVKLQVQDVVIFTPGKIYVLPGLLDSLYIAFTMTPHKQATLELKRPTN